MDKTSLTWALRRYWFIIVGLTLLGGAAGALPNPPKATDTTTTITTWQAAHTLLISSTSATESILSDPITFNQLQLFATVGEVPARVAQSIGYDGPPAALSAQVVVDLQRDTGAMRFSTAQPTADDAVTIADAFASEFGDYLTERQDRLRETRIAANLDRLSELEAQITPLEIQVVEEPNNEIARAQLDALGRQYSVAFEQSGQLQQDQGQLAATTLESAQAIAITNTQGGITAPRSRRSRGTLGAIVGALGGLAVAVLLTKADRRLRTREQIEQALDLQAQVAIQRVADPDASQVVVVPDRHDALSDSFRTLRSVIGFVEGGTPRTDNRAPIVLVVSASSGDGKTTITSNLAAAFVETGSRTIAVNADFRRPTLTKRLTGERASSHEFDLMTAAAMPPELFMRPTEHPDLAIVDLAGLPGGTPGSLARLTARSLGELAKIADTIVIDSSPLGATAEVLELIPAADIIVMVVRIDHTLIDTATRSIKVVRSLTDVPVLLAVMGDNTAGASYYHEYAAAVPVPKWPDTLREFAAKLPIEQWRSTLKEYASKFPSRQSRSESESDGTE